jgi:hypothetical protein
MTKSPATNRLSKRSTLCNVIVWNDMAERGGLKPQAFQNPRFTKEIAAIPFTVASFQIARVKRYEVRRSSKKPKKWRKTVACSSPRGKSTVLDSSLCPKYRRFNRMTCSLELPRTGLDTNLNPHLPLRTELSRAETFLLAVFLVGLIRSASIGSPRVETAINHASSPNSRPLAGLLSPNT